MIWDGLLGRRTEPPAIAAVTDAFITAAMGTNATAFTKLFVAEPDLTDAMPPFHWQGPGAAAAYFADLQKTIKEISWTNFSLARIAPDEMYGNKIEVYSVIPLNVNYTVGGLRKQDRGIFTLTLRNDSGAWKITSAGWAYTYHDK